jgi:hypothetical protein
MPKVLMFLLVLAGLFVVMFPPDTTVEGVLNCKAPKDDKIICTLTEE